MYAWKSKCTTFSEWLTALIGLAMQVKSLINSYKVSLSWVSSTTMLSETDRAIFRCIVPEMLADLMDVFFIENRALRSIALEIVGFISVTFLVVHIDTSQESVPYPCTLWR